MQTTEKRSTNLFRYFGWTGGTIHQVAQETGVDVQSLLYGEPSAAHMNSKYSNGACASETCGLAYRAELAKSVKGDRDYWIGVANSRPVD